MLPGLTELLMAAQVTLVSPTALPPTVGQPITQQALQPLSLAKVNCKYADFCCSPADGCKCNGTCKP
ncbi:MAG: hypothetical protein ACLQLG_11720 [Thermoguttaceae bacterium]